MSAGEKAALKAPLIATASAADPFYTIRDVLDGEVRALRVKFEEWRGLLGTANTAADIPFRLKHDDFQKALLKTEGACSKLKIVISNITKDRRRFPHIDDRELERRRALVGELDESLNMMRGVFFGRETKAKLESDQRKELAKRAAEEVTAAAASSSSYAKANSEFVREHAQEQTMIRRQQDEALGALSGSLSRVGEMALTIKDELKEQDKMLDDIHEQTDIAQTKMDSAISKVEKLLKTKDRCQICTILILVVAFVVVAIVAFYTIVG